MYQSVSSNRLYLSLLVNYNLMYLFTSVVYFYIVSLYLFHAFRFTIISRVPNSYTKGRNLMFKLIFYP